MRIPDPAAYLLFYVRLGAALLLDGIGGGLHGSGLAGDGLAGHNLALGQALVVLSLQHVTSGRFKPADRIQMDPHCFKIQIEKKELEPDLYSLNFIVKIS